MGTPDWTRTETPADWDYQVHYPSRSACATNQGLIFEVGPGKAFANPRDVPWLSLMPCDQVLIYYRNTPYTDIILLGARGAPNQYITVRGVPGPNGERPVFDGRGAVMPTNTGVNQYIDSAGMIIIVKPSIPARTYTYKPGYLHITGLTIRNVHPPSLVTDSTGSTHVWGNTSDGFVAAIYVSPAEHVAITDCELADSGLGLFVNSQDDEASQSRDILVRNNYFHGNGMVNNAGKHNAYTEAIGTIYEYNYFDAPVSGTGGDNIKERSAGIIFRYNYIADGVNLIALRDPQSNSGFESLAKDSLGQFLVSMAFVYGNILAAKNPTVYHDAPIVVSPGDGIFGDGKQVRYGSLYFYNNRVVSTLDSVAYALSSVTLFDPINTRSPITVVARNNLFYATSKTPSGTAAPFALFFWQGLADWQSNWINQFQNVHATAGDSGLAAGTKFDGTGLGGLPAQTNSPGFLDFAAGVYLTTGTSPYAGLTAPLPAAATARGLTVTDNPVIQPFTAPPMP